MRKVERSTIRAFENVSSQLIQRRKLLHRTRDASRLENLIRTVRNDFDGLRLVAFSGRAVARRSDDSRLTWILISRRGRTLRLVPLERIDAESRIFRDISAKTDVPELDQLPRGRKYSSDACNQRALFLDSPATRQSWLLINPNRSLYR